MMTPRLRRHRDRAAARGVPHRPYTEADVWAKTGGRCHLCGRALDRGAWHLDHVLPLARGGPDVLANVAPACPPCNMAKGARVVKLPEGELRRALLGTVAAVARLHKLGIAAGAARPVIAPHVSTLRILPPAGAVGRPPVAELRAALRSPLARVTVHGHEWRIEVPRAKRRRVGIRHLPAPRWPVLPVGIDTDNRPAAIDLAASPHVLVAGITGSGKSVMLRTLALQLARAGARLVLVDSDADTWAPLSHAQALAVAVAETDAESDAAVAWAQAAMHARDASRNWRPIVIIIDEVHRLTPRAMDALRDVAQNGRKFRVHAIIATQYVRRDVIDRVISQQFGWRAAGRLLDSTASKLALGQPGAEALAGAGDMLIAQGGRMVRIQAALATPADFASLPQLDRAPEPARADVAPDPRYVRKDNSGRVEWLIDRYASTGAAPSQYALNRAFGGNAHRNTRAAREAADRLGLTG